MSQRVGPENAGATVVGLMLQRSEPEPRCHMISVTGEVDMLTAPQLSELITAELAAADRCLVLDLTGVSFLGSSGLVALVAARDLAAQHAVALRLVCSSSTVLRPIMITGLTQMFSIHDSLADALAQS